MVQGTVQATCLPKSAHHFPEAESFWGALAAMSDGSCCIQLSGGCLWYHCQLWAQEVLHGGSFQRGHLFYSAAWMRRGPRYLEIDTDVGSSSTAHHVTGMVQGALKSVIVDIGVLLEGRATVRIRLLHSICLKGTSRSKPWVTLSNVHCAVLLTHFRL